MTTTMAPITREDRNFFHSENIAYMGDYVQDHLGRKGRVYAVHFSCPENKSWLALQRHLPGSDPEAWRDARWVSVLVHNSGSVVLPEQMLTIIEPFSFANASAGFYFRPEN